MAKIAELTPGVDIRDVMKAVGLDTRINPRGFDAGIGFGGYIYPKHIKALELYAYDRGYKTRLINSILEINDNQAFDIVGKPLT